MPLALPTTPTCISDATPVCDRVAMLNDMADRDANNPAVMAMARRAADRAAATPAPNNKPDARERILALEAMRVVQAVGYVDDQGDRDCYQGAEYTIGHGGECKALSVLFAAVCHRLRLDAEVVWITQTGAPRNHVAPVVTIGGERLWADCSIDGAMLGESPYDAVKRTASWNVIGATAPASQAIASWTAPRWTPARTQLWPWHGWDRHWLGWPAAWWQLFYPSIYFSRYQPLRLPRLPVTVQRRDGLVTEES